ncbi:MAG: hypothetical protein AABP62_08510 [Planctomycetota bacterium]
MTFGTGGRLHEVMYAGAGCLHIRRKVYLAVMRHQQLPVCNERFGTPMNPFFHPMLNPIDGGTWYLAEDYSFAQRARAAGFKIHADTVPRLWHYGNYPYGWEEAGRDAERFDTFTLSFGSVDVFWPNAASLKTLYGQRICVFKAIRNRTQVRANIGGIERYSGSNPVETDVKPRPHWAACNTSRGRLPKLPEIHS